MRDKKMRHFMSSVLLLPVLAGCGAAVPEQTPEQIRAEIAKIPPPRPGLWEAHFTLTEFSASGGPEGADERMRRELEARGRLGQVTCVTPESAKSAVEEGLVRYDGAFCQVQSLRVKDGGYDATLACEHDNGVVATVELGEAPPGDTVRSTARVTGTLKSNPDARFTYAAEQTDKFKGKCPTE